MTKIITVKLTPKAAADRIGDPRQLPNGETQLMVYVKAVPENGKANAAMLALLAKHYDLAPSRFTILRGHTARNKQIRID